MRLGDIDNDVALLLAGFDVAVSISDILQRILAVDKRLKAAGLDLCAKIVKILRGVVGRADEEVLVAQSRRRKAANRVTNTGVR